MGGSSKPQNVNQTTRTEIPEFLRPYLETQARVGQTALTGLQDSLSNGLPNYQQAGISPLQRQSYEMLNGLVPGTQGMQFMQGLMNSGGGSAQTMLQSAMSNPTGIYQNSLDGLRKIGQGGWIDKMMPTFNGGIDQAISGQFMPGSASNTLDQFATNGYQLSGNARNALEGSAAGNGLFGSPGFDQAVQASIRAAQPAIASTFSNAGSGGLKSGLAQTAMQQAASDSFARLYGDERNRQLASAQQLGSFGLAGRDQQIGAATQRGNLALGEQGLRTQATLGLGGLMSQERDRQLDALKSAPGIGLMGINALHGMESQQEGMDLSRALAMNGMESNEFQQGMQKTNALYGMGSDHQSWMQQGLDMQRLNQMNPILAQQMMLAAANGIPIESLMGQNTSGTQDIYRNRTTGGLGGVATGLGIGAMTAPAGATGIAALGGPWGLAFAAGMGLLGAYL